jgi:hypothetical protein
VKQLFFILSVLIIATIAFDRYRMISSMSKSSAHKYTAYAVGVWTTSLLLCSPILYFITIQRDINQDSGEVIIRLIFMTKNFRSNSLNARSLGFSRARKNAKRFIIQAPSRLVTVPRRIPWAHVTSHFLNSKECTQSLFIH